MTLIRPILAVFTVLMLLTGAAMAQSPDAAAPQAAASGTTAMPSARQMLAHRLTLLARAALVSPDQSQPAEAQITQARILLDQANALDDADSERWLLTAEACDLAHDSAGRIDAIKHYIHLAPEDDVAQLRFIDLLLDKMQTADQRLAYLRNIADGSLSSRFSAPLRSRVAYRAAMLAAAQGQPQSYGRLLTLALQLDSTNKPAAAESLRVLTTAADTTVREHAAALLTLFHADPADPLTHAAIGRMLMSQLRYGDAATWFAQAAQIQNANRQPAPIAVVHEWAMALWGDGRGTDAVQLLAQLDPPKPPAPTGEADASAPESATESAPESAPESAASAKPNPDWPPLDTLMLRAAILANNGTDTELDAAFKRLDDRFLAQLRNTPDAPAVLAAQAWAQLLCNQHTDQTAAILDKLSKLPNASDIQLPLMRGWLAMRTGQTDAAKKLLEPAAKTDPRALLALSLLQIMRGDTDAPAQGLRYVASQSPTDIFGLIAGSQLRHMNNPLPLSDDARQVAAVFDAVPDDLRHMAAKPMRFVQIRLRPTTMRYEFGQPLVANLELRNVSSYPLSLEPAGSMPGRLLISPSAVVDLQSRPQLGPIIINLSRRLRLDAFHTLTIPVRLDSGSLGALLTVRPWSLIQIDALAVLNPTLNAGGAFVPGMLGSTSFVRSIVRRNIPLTSQSINDSVTQLGGSDPAASMRAMALVIAALPHDDKAVADQTQAADNITKTLTNEWGGFAAAQRAYLVSLIPPGNDVVTKQLAPVLADAARDDQPLVRLLLLATQVNTADDPVLNAALRNSDATVRTFAQALRTAIQQRPKPPQNTATP